MEPPQKKSRAPPRNARQFNYMVDYMLQNQHVALYKFGNSFHDKEDINKGWNSLVEELNKIGPAKSRNSWEKTWKDSKGNAAKKFSALRKERDLTGNTPLPEEIKSGLTDTDIKIVSILGHEYVAGSSTCADSIPDSTDDLQALMEGREVELDVPLQNPAYDGIFESVNATGDMSANLAEEIESIEMAPVVIVPGSAHNPSAASTPSAKRTPAPGTTKNRVLGRSRGNRETLGTQYREAREEFASRQHKHCDALQACASALNKMAENESRRLVLEQERLEIERERLRVMEGLCTVLNSWTNGDTEDIVIVRMRRENPDRPV